MSAAATDERVVLAPGEQQAINRMGDAFRSALKAQPEAPPAAVAPADPKPAAQPKPAEAKPAESAKTSPAVSEPPKDVPKQEGQPTEISPPELRGKARESWDKLETLMRTHKADAYKYKAERDTLASEIATSKTELETLRKGSAEYERVKTELATSQKELKQRDEWLQEFALEHDPRFHGHYTDRIKRYAETVKDFVNAEHAVRLEQLFQLPPSKIRDEQIAALATELNAENAAGAMAVSNALVNIKVIEREKAGELARSAENLAQLKLAEQKRIEQEQSFRQQTQNTLIESAYKSIDPELEGVDKDEIKAIKEQTRDLIAGTIGNNGLISMVTLAAKGRKYDATVAALKEENAKLTEQVAALTSATPPVNGTGGEPRIQRTGPPDNSDISTKFHTELNKRKAAGQR